MCSSARAALSWRSQLTVCRSARAGYRAGAHNWLCAGQHEQAIELALTIHVELAVRCAAGQLAGGPLSPDTSKKLWLRVARYHLSKLVNITYISKCFVTQWPPFQNERVWFEHLVLTQQPDLMRSRYSSLVFPEPSYLQRIIEFTRCCWLAFLSDSHPFGIMLFM